MENSTANLTEKLSDSQAIIAQLEEQNKTLHAILNFHLAQERKAFRRAFLSFIVHAIPYIIIIVLGFYIYQTVHAYLDTLNNNINALNNEFTSVKTSITNIPGEIQGSVQNGLNSINPFK